MEEQDRKMRTSKAYRTHRFRASELKKPNVSSELPNSKNLRKAYLQSFRTSKAKEKVSCPRTLQT